MEPLAFCVQYVKHPKIQFMNTMACLAISFTFYSRTYAILHIYSSRKHNTHLLSDSLESFQINSFLFLNTHRPSSSKPEKIRSAYYDAEYHGRMQECHQYSDNCSISFLDLISHMVSIDRFT